MSLNAPLLRNALVDPTLNTRERPYSEARMDRWDEAITEWEAAVEAGTIANARYKDLKDTLNRGLEQAWRRQSEHLLAGVDRQTLDPAYDDVLGFYSGPTLSNGVSLAKKWKALPEHPFKATLLAFLDAVAPLQASNQQLKNQTVKRQVKTEEERTAERYAAPPVVGQAAQKVQQMLEDVMKRGYIQLRDHFMAQYQSQFDEFNERLEHFKQHPQDLPKDSRGFAVSYYGPAQHFFLGKPDARGRRVVDGGAVSRIVKVFDLGYQPNGTYAYTPRPDAQAIMAADSEAQANDIRKAFVAKNLRKIVAILDGKEKGGSSLTESRVLGTTLDLSSFTGEFRFGFSDASAFTVRNAVVFVENEQGTRFLRFPLTFHNVVMPGGSKMNQPSERRMNELFVPAVAPDAEDASVRVRRPRM